MTEIESSTAQELVSTYIRAKDENRPWLMSRVFADNATLRILSNPGTLSFPAATTGLEAITDVLVRQFARRFENVYTFCISAPPAVDAATFSCPWLVAMSEKDTQTVRVGGGRYDWTFRSGPPRLVETLGIHIELMHTLDPATLGAIMGWLSRLRFPWCAMDELAGNAPALGEIDLLVRYLEQETMNAHVR